jgi:hypothetical protein
MASGISGAPSSPGCLAENQGFHNITHYKLYTTQTDIERRQASGRLKDTRTVLVRVFLKSPGVQSKLLGPSVGFVGDWDRALGPLSGALSS